jgi:serine/threonine protein phosphatase PrpC
MEPKEPKDPKKKLKNSTNNFQTTNRKPDKQLSDIKKAPKRNTIHSVKVIPTLSLEKEKNLQQKPSILTLDLLNKKYDEYELPKFSNKQIGPLKSYSFNTYQGLYKDYNEDKIIVSSLLKKPTSSKLKTWPKISYFAIFDGHGGEECSEFLKENYDKYLIENKNFPFDIKLSMIETFQKIEEDFFKLKCKEDSFEDSDKSGSCALVAIIFDNKVYIANIGDSRAIMSINGGTKVKQLTVDHKPDNVKEFERALKTGSKIYLDDNDDPFRDESTLEFIKDKIELEKMKEIKNNTDDEKIFRVFPSDLAVMRTIGDIKAKKKEFGGIPGTIINIPDIFIFEINSNDDFIVMGCDGIYDDLSNEEIVNAAWLVFKNRGKEKNYDIHELSMEACDIIIKYGLEKQTTDNLSCIIIGLEGVEKFLKNNQLKKKVNSINNFKKEFKRASTLK